GKIYNVTNWANHHPGGVTPLLNLAGQDVTDAFLALHPSSAWKYLDQFFTGYHLQDYNFSETSKDYRKLVSEFTKLGLYEKKGHVVMILMILISIMIFMSVYGVLFSNNFWFILLVVGHYQVMINPKFNRFAQFLSGNCIAGISIAWWKWTHNAHHIAVNSLDFDPDLQHMPFFVVSTKFFSSLTSSFYDRKMNFDSISRFWSVSASDILPCNVLCKNQPLCSIIYVVVFKEKFSYLPNWYERISFVVASFAVTGIQHVQFCLNHFSSNHYVGPPSGSDWFEKQTSGTLDIDCPPWMDWFFGGLQFQVAHHLFPRMPRCHLRKISPLVKELCKKHNLPYNCASFWKANALTFNTLRNAALQARDLSNPVPKNLVWEAVNTHG
ncbi:Delta(8)-fatty-acid desaturase, partial [Bienertia sinuspersici]